MTREVAGQSEAFLSLVLTRGPAATDAGAARETQRVAPRARPRAGAWTSFTMRSPMAAPSGCSPWSSREIAASLSGRTVGETLDRVLVGVRSPTSITVGHGTEFMSRALETWAFARGLQLDFIHTGKPVENALSESFHGRLRDDYLLQYQCTSTVATQAKTDAWRIRDHQLRLHGSLGHLTPDEYARRDLLQSRRDLLDRTSLLLHVTYSWPARGRLCRRNSLSGWSEKAGAPQFGTGPTRYT